MKLKAALKKVQKTLGVEMKQDGQRFFAPYKNKVFSFCTNGRMDDDLDVHCFHCRGKNDENDYLNDYHAGAFWDNLGQLVNYLKTL